MIELSQSAWFESKECELCLLQKSRNLYIEREREREREREGGGRERER